MASAEEKESLLRGPTEASSSYGGEHGKTSGGSEGKPADQKQQNGSEEAKTTDGDDVTSKQKKTSSKHGRLQRNPSLDKVDEDEKREKAQAKEEKRSGCPDYFGVRSYLHHMYEAHVFKDPTIYEEDDDVRELLRSNPRRRRCASIWWKVFVWIGANFLIFGVIGVLVGYLVPQRPIIESVGNNNIERIDKEAMAFNFNLDVCKLVGLILFCIGGLTLTVALLFPSFLYHYCEDDRRDQSFKVSIGEEKPVKSPIEMTIPATPTISGVQPQRKGDEAVVTQEGMVAYKD